MLFQLNFVWRLDDLWTGLLFVHCSASVSPTTSYLETGSYYAPRQRLTNDRFQ